MPRRRAAAEGLDDDHLAAATRTRRRDHRLAICRITISMLSLRLWHGEKIAGGEPDEAEPIYRRVLERAIPGDQAARGARVLPVLSSAGAG